MNAVMGHHAVVVTNPTAQDAAGAKSYEIEAAVKVLRREPLFEFVD